MIIIELEGKEYNMPQSWEEVSLEMFEKIVDLTSIFSEFQSRYQFSIEMLSILTSAPKEQLSKMSKKSFEELATACEWSQQQITTKSKKKFNIDGEEYLVIKDLNSLEMGDMVSLELMIGNSSPSNLLINILPILIRKAKVINKSGKVVKVPGPFVAEEYELLRDKFKRNLNVADVNDLKDFF
jgi:hypothetical protein